MKTLKKIVCIFLLSGSVAAASAQQINYRNEKIYLNNQPYGYLYKRGSVWAKDYSFQTIRDEEVATAKAINKEMANGHDYVYYEITFKGYTRKAEMDNDKDFGRRFAFELAGYNVLKNDVLDPEGVEKFLARFPNTISKRLDGVTVKKEVEIPKLEPKPEVKAEANAVVANESAKVQPVKSEPTIIVVNVPVPVAPAPAPAPEVKPEPKPEPVKEAAPVAAPVEPKNILVPGVKVSGTSILKGKKKVGKFVVTEKIVNDNLKKNYSFYNAKNVKVAAASFDTPQSTACKIYTNKDKKNRTVPVINNGTALKALSGWLVQNRYL